MQKIMDFSLISSIEGSNAMTDCPVVLLSWFKTLVKDDGNYLSLPDEI